MIRIFKVAERLVCAFKLCVNVSKWLQTEQLHVGERKQERWRKENKKEQIKSPTVDFFFFSLQSVLAVSIFPSCSNSQWENLASRKTLERRQIPDWVRFYSSLVGFPVRDIHCESTPRRVKWCEGKNLFCTISSYRLLHGLYRRSLMNQFREHEKTFVWKVRIWRTAAPYLTIRSYLK